MEKLKVDAGGMQVGKTKVFLKDGRHHSTRMIPMILQLLAAESFHPDAACVSKLDVMHKASVLDQLEAALAASPGP